MAEAAAARREARRRKILENSDNRLKYISGRESEPVTKENKTDDKFSEINDVVDSSDNINLSIPAESNGNILFETPYPSEEPYQIFEDPEIETLTSLPPRHSRSQGQVTKSKSKPLFSYKIDILILSLIIQFCHAFSYIDHDLNLILPLIVYSTTKMCFIPVVYQSGLTNALLVMNGISPDKAQKLLNILQMIRNVIDDGFFYMFYIITVQSFLYFLWK